MPTPRDDRADVFPATSPVPNIARAVRPPNRAVYLIALSSRYEPDVDPALPNSMPRPCWLSAATPMLGLKLAKRMPSGSTGEMASASVVVWRPRASVPHPPSRPTQDARSKVLLALAEAPVSAFSPLSNWNSALAPPPRSSLPRSPQRLVVCMPLPRLCDEPGAAALAAVRPLPWRSPRSTVPYSVTPLVCAAMQLLASAAQSAPMLPILFLIDVSCLIEI